MNAKGIVIAVVLMVLGYVPVRGAGPDVSQCTKKTFRVTSYYSPLSTQSYYFQGSYDDEVTLNGKGTHGASGLPVFNGMIAAPKSYAFGTKIYFPGRGIGQVADRGGAIVEKGERGEQYDRIDIRAGKGEEGLQRALSFGVQYLEGYVCNEGIISQEAGFDYAAFPQYDDFFVRTLSIVSLSPGRRDPWVAILQRYLVTLGYLTEESITGFYGRLTTAAVCVYQQKKLGLDPTHESCGHVGPQTRTHLIKHIAQLPKEDVTSVPIVDSADQGSDKEKPLITNVNDAALNDYLFTVGEFKGFQFTEPFVKGQQSKVVRILQRKLSRLGYYEQERDITGVYDDYTVQAVYAFQRANSLVRPQDDMAVQGYFGPQTRSKLTRCATLCVQENGNIARIITLAGEVVINK